MKNIDQISQALFDKVRSRFSDVSLGDEQANSTTNPEQARFFNFQFRTSTDKPLSMVTLSLIDSQALRVYFSKRLPTDITEEEKTEWYEFLRGLRKFARHNLLTFEPKDIAKSNLELRDIKQQVKTDSAYTATEFNTELAESVSKLYGKNAKRSFQDVGSTRIVIEHSTNIDESVRGSRSRKIHSIFLETADGERYKLAYNNLPYARAMAVHVNQGGNPYDKVASAINVIAEEMQTIGSFVRSMRTRTFEDADTQDMVESATERYGELRETIKRLTKKSHYDKFVGDSDSYLDDANGIDEESDETIELNELRERFVKKIYNEKFDKALGYVYKAHKRRKSKSSHPNMEDQFEQWAESVVESTWQLPDTDSEIRDLDKVMKKPIELGINAENIIGILDGIIGDDDLYSELDYLARKNPELDARPTIVNWLESNGFESLADKYRLYLKTSQADEPSGKDDRSNVNESKDSLTVLRKFAGLSN